MKKLLVFLMAAVIVFPIAASGSQEGTTAAAAGDGMEAPELAAMVASGELPPLEERLPNNPLVVKPLEAVGTYGGTWHNMLVGGSLTHLTRYIGYERLLRWTPEWDGIIPNIAESFDVSPDSTEFTFYLREGMKWSDGEPFTADDFEFLIEDILFNETVTPSFPGNLKSAGEPVVFTKIDDYTIRYSFAAPNGLFLQNQTNPGMLFLPKHYLQQFHIKYNEDADKQAKEAGYADWVEMLLSKGASRGNNDIYSNADYPTVEAWHFTVAPGEGTTTLAIAERNPYYFKTDPAGKQLPYLDSLEFAMLADNEVALLKALNGEIDFHDQHISSPANKSVLYDNQDQGNYRFVTTTPGAPNAMSIMFNMNHPDPERRAIFGNKDFRIGMSHAINRQEIIDIVFAGEGTPHQVSPRPESDLYNEKMATQYIEYDPDLAGEYLDKVGLDKKDSQGYRLMPNGERLIILFEIDAVRDTFIDGLELMTGYFKDVGIEIQVKTMDRPLWETRVRQGALMDATIHRFGGGVGSIVLTDPRYYFPFSGNSIFAKAWQTWYANPTGLNAQVAPEEPPENVKRQMELYDELKVTGDEEKQKVIMREILEIATEVFYHVGVCTEPNGFAIANKDLVNVPDSMPWNWIYPHPAPTNPSTWFYK